MTVRTPDGNCKAFLLPFKREHWNQKFCTRIACQKDRQEKKKEVSKEKRTYTCQHCHTERENTHQGPNPSYCPDNPECQEVRKKYINHRAIANRNEWAGHTGARKDNKRKMGKRYCRRCHKWKRGTFHDRCPLCQEKQASIYWHLEEQAGFPS